MNRYLKSFLHRGMVFGGLGPIVMGIVYLILYYTITDLSLSGEEVFLAILSTYFLAFIQAGASVFNQIESFSLTKSLFLHMGTLYLAYVGCYLINSWIPFDGMFLLIFTAIFLLTYMIIWVTVFFCTKLISNKFNQKLNSSEN